LAGITRLRRRALASGRATGEARMLLLLLGSKLVHARGCFGSRLPSKAGRVQPTSTPGRLRPHSGNWWRHRSAIRLWWFQKASRSTFGARQRQAESPRRASAQM